MFFDAPGEGAGALLIFHGGSDMRISGNLAMPPGCTALEWLIDAFNGLTGEHAETLSSGPRPFITIYGDTIPLPDIPGADPGSVLIILRGTDLAFSGGLAPQGSGTVTEIVINAEFDGEDRNRFVTLPEPVPLDAILSETARDLDTTSKRIEDNPGFASLVLPDGYFLDETGTPDGDLIKGFDTDDSLRGGAGDDTITGQGGNDLITDFAGDDLLRGGAGVDTLDGGAGSDTLLGTVEEFNMDVIEALALEDELHLLSFGGAFSGPGQFDLREESLFISGPDVEIMLPNRDPVMAFDVERAGDDVIFRLVEPGIERRGGEGPEDLGGARGPDTLFGGPGNDTLTGFDGDDRLLGEGDDDLLRGGDGNDTLNGGDGDDLILGGETEGDLSDVIFGGTGNDALNGSYGNDQVFGQEGNDTLSGGFGADELQGQEGDDVVTGGALSDLVFGGSGNDFVNGGFGHDRINGGDGSDRFFHLGVADHGSDWVQDYDAVEGDVLVFGTSEATRDQFQINLAHTATPDGERSGDDDVQEAFVIYRPTGQIMWALVDGEGQSGINLQIGGEIFDMLA